MELPFAVADSSSTLPGGTATGTAASLPVVDDDSSSLVTASSQGSFLTSTAEHQQLQQHPQQQHPSAAALPMYSNTTAAATHHHHHSSSSNNNPPPTEVSFSSSPMMMMTPQQSSTISPPVHQQTTTTSAVNNRSSPQQQANNNSNNNAVVVGGGMAMGHRVISSVLSPFAGCSGAGGGTAGRVSSPQQQQLGGETEIIDFTSYVNVEDVTDADEVDILLMGDYNYLGEFGMGGSVSGTGPQQRQRQVHEPVSRHNTANKNTAKEARPLDVLAILLSGTLQNSTNNNHNNNNNQAAAAAPEQMVSLSEQANQQVLRAMAAKRAGDLTMALESHSAAAKLFHEAARLLRGINNNNNPNNNSDGDSSSTTTTSSSFLASSLLLLSQTEAKSALALKRIMKVRGGGPIKGLIFSSSTTTTLNNNSSNKEKNAQTERLRATVRGALDQQQPQPEADISDSAFLGRATKDPPSSEQQQQTNKNLKENSSSSAERTIISSKSTTKNKNSKNDSKNNNNNNNNSNPVDEMMQLERELRDMDMALELGNSLASCRLKNTTPVDGSFMVVPPGLSSSVSNSYMSSSMILGAGPSPPTASQRNTSTGSRAVRPKNLVQASTTRPTQQYPQVVAAAAPPPVVPHHVTTKSNTSNNNGLESSWWGNSSSIAASQVLTSSVASLVNVGATTNAHATGGSSDASSANTKQLMRLMDSLRVLGDENASLMREVEGANAARAEALAAKKEMRRFKEEYGKRFEALKAALEKFRKGYPDDSASPAAAGGGTSNPVTNSEFIRTASTSEQLARQEQLIRKLTADLKKEKEESKKKDAALRKYESFYREVKARSAQKAAQRQKETQQQQQQQQHTGHHRHHRQSHNAHGSSRPSR